MTQYRNEIRIFNRRGIRRNACGIANEACFIHYAPQTSHHGILLLLVCRFFFFLLLRARLVFLFFSDGFDPWRKTFLLSSRRANCLANGSLFREKRTLQSRKSHPEPENVSAVFEDSSSFHLSLKWLRNSFVTTASKQRSILSSTPPKSSR